MPSFRDEVTADTPKIFLGFDETTGQHLDLTANAHNTTVISVAGQGTRSPGAGWSGAGSGDDFDGAANYASVPASTDFYAGVQGSFSIMAVAATDTVDGTYRRVVGYEIASHGWVLTAQDVAGTNHPDDGWRFERRGGGGTGVFVSSNATTSTGTIPTPGTTYMVHATFEVTATNTATLRLYVNGVEVAAKTGQTIADMTDPATALNIGRRGYDNSRFLDGGVFAFAYFPTVLSSGRVAAHYAARDTTATDPALNTNISVTVGNKARLRIIVQETAGTPVAVAYKLRMSKNSGAYADVATATGDVRVVDSANFTHAAATTEVLPGGTGSFVAGQGLDTSGTSSSISLSAAGNTQLEWSLQLVAGTPGDTYDFRVTRSDGTALDAYTVTPRITAA